MKNKSEKNETSAIKTLLKLLNSSKGFTRFEKVIVLEFRGSHNKRLIRS